MIFYSFKYKNNYKKTRDLKNLLKCIIESTINVANENDPYGALKNKFGQIISANSNLKKCLSIVNGIRMGLKCENKNYFVCKKSKNFNMKIKSKQQNINTFF